MYLNWYHNFWRIADDIGIRDDFVPQAEMNYLKRDEFGRPPQLTNVGALGSAWHNLFSGVVSPADMVIYGYSLIDLLGSRAPPAAALSNTSVYDFLTSRLYMTDEAVALHGQTLAKAFANPTYLNAAQTYQKFIGFGFRQPAPMTWLLKGNTQQYLFEPLQARLQELNVDIRTLHRVDRIEVENNKIARLTVSRLREPQRNTPPVVGRRGVPAAETFDWPLSGDLILAVPVEGLSQLLDIKTFLWAPELGDVRRLPAQPMASLDVYFRRKLPNVPAGVTLLLDSPFDLTFVDNSQLWRDGGPQDVTFINLVMSDLSIFAKFDESCYLPLIKEYMFSELRHYIEFDYQWQTPSRGRPDDVDRDRSYMRIGKPLFTNEVGTWPYRPAPTCAIANLFIAGDFCRTFVDVVTIEGAAVSGLMAAEALRERANVGERIEIIEPNAYPQGAMAALKWIGAPYAYGAKAWTMMTEGFTSRVDEMFPNG
jgi:uncharacterized protein with NAD-binding domain and iron-sulfur cluster